MNIQLSFFILGVFVRGAHGLSCGECNHDNTTESCGPPPSCEETVLDACGCCPLCAKLENESCGGPWNTLGSCADGLVCHPVSMDKPVLGAGGYYSESWDPAGVCVNSYNYQRDHSRCAQLLAAYQDFLKALEGHSTNDDPDMTARDDDDDTTVTMTTTTQTETTTISCVRKPSCTPDGGFAPLQCDGCAGECWCAFHDGREIRGTRGHYRSVRC